MREVRRLAHLVAIHYVAEPQEVGGGFVDDRRVGTELDLDG